jgi:hypothetical protein
MQSVASHRASVPDVISKALEQQLHAMRPDGCAVGAAAAGGDDDAVGPTGEGKSPQHCLLTSAAATTGCSCASASAAGAHMLTLCSYCLERWPDVTDCVLSCAACRPSCLRSRRS